MISDSANLASKQVRPIPVADARRSRTIDRRRFIAAAGAAVALANVPSESPNALAARPTWSIGCFNRAWAKLPSDRAFAAIRAAGYQVVGLISDHDDYPISAPASAPAASDKTLAAIRELLADNGLTANMTALRYSEDAADKECETAVLTQLDRAAALGVGYVMTFGADKPQNHPRYFRLMAKAAERAAERKLQLVLKPHGGISATAADMQRCLDAVAHDNFSIWYDAGNIVHYTGKDPVEELKPIAKHVTGLCAKDCPGKGGEVMIQFGAGVVDFRGVLAVLQEARFDGPIMVEGIRAGATPEETTAFAKANREFLETAIGAL